MRKNHVKASLKDMLAQYPEPKRNDWSNGRPGATSQAKVGGDGFPEYDPKAFESGSDDEEGGPSAGGAFAVLAALQGNAEADDGEWEVATSKNKKRTAAAAPTPVAAPAPATAAARRPAPAPVPAATRAPALAAGLASGARPGGASALAAGLGLASGSGAGAGPSTQRAPYALLAPALAQQPQRSPRPQTHDSEGRPISDTYYQTFQKVYRNSNGSVCMRFHKTDIITVKLNGEIVLSNGGFNTYTTFLSLSEGLRPLGLEMRKAADGSWDVALADGSRVAFEDGMVLPVQSDEERRRGERLFAAYNGGIVEGRQTAAPAADPGPSQPIVPAASAATGASASAAPRPAPSAWSYRTAAGTSVPPSVRSAATTSQAAATGSSGGASSSAPAAPTATNPTPRTAASTGELAAVLTEALTIQGQQGQQEVDEEFACIVCFAAPKSTILECGHCVMCLACTKDIMERKRECPVCRAPLVTFFMPNA